MLDRIWPAHTDGYRVIIGIKSGRVNQRFCATREEITQAVADFHRQGADIYFAPSMLSETRRTQQAVSMVSAFWLDLDAGAGKPYDTPQAALAALRAFLERSGIPAPTVLVGSGYGIHVYWTLSTPIPASRWKQAAERLKRACRVHSLSADPQRTADSASIMRFPGTVNLKDPAAPRPVRILKDTGRNLDPDAFEAALPATGPIGVVRESVKGEWSTATALPPGHAPTIASKCAQMAHVWEARGAVEEPLWRAALSIVWRCEDGSSLVHEWSKGDERYDPTETENKARRTEGPATCAWFGDNAPDRCQGCPWAGKITSPIQIAVGASGSAPAPGEPALLPADDDGYFRPSRIGPFTIGRAGIHMSSGVDGEPPEKIAECALYVLEVRERARLDHEPDQSTLLVEWHGIDGRVRRGVLPQAVVYEQRAFSQWLAQHNIRAQVHKLGGLMSAIAQLTREVLRQRAVKTYYENLGWHEDRFVLGPTSVTKDGPTSTLVKSNSPIASIRIKGDAADWTQAMSLLNERELWPHQSVILAGFGSAVLGLTGTHSAVLSLTGRSGFGKTLAARAALSIYGPPEHLMQSALATPNAIEAQLGMHRNVPYLLDEVTNMAASKLAELVYMMANGQGKAAMTRKRELRDVATWHLVPIITSNHAVLQASDTSIEEAHRRRILELPFGAPVSTAVGAAVDGAIKRNPGAAALPYLHWIQRHRDRIPQLFEDSLRYIREVDPEIPDANRHGLWTVAAMRVGGTVARALGLVPFDVERCVRYTLSTLRENAVETSTEEQRIQEAVVEFLATYSRHVCHWAQDAQFAGLAVDDPVARMLSPSLVALHNTRWRQWANDRKLNFNAAQTYWRRAVVGRKPIKLTPGVPSIYSLVVDLDKLGLMEADKTLISS